MSFEGAAINQIYAAGAPDFVTVAAESLLDVAIKKFEADTGRTLAPSQVEMYLLETISFMLSVRGAEEQIAFENCFVAYARDEWLDIHGAERNMPRLEAKPASTVLRFSADVPVGGRIKIPAGTRVSDANGQAQFLTLASSYIEIGQSEIDVTAQAAVAGISANGFAVGALNLIVDPVPGIAAVTNLTETGGGANREESDRYRARLSLTFERIGDGLSKERYNIDVLSWSARCIDVEITRPQPGYVSIYPLMDTGAPNAQELASLLSVFNESNTHQGDFIQVFAPTAHAFSFVLALTLSDPDAQTHATDAVQSVLQDWGKTLGGYIAPSELIRAAKGNAGVVEADIPDLDLTLLPDNAWRVGTISNVTVEVV